MLLFFFEKLLLWKKFFFSIIISKDSLYLTYSLSVMVKTPRLLFGEKNDTFSLLYYISHLKILSDPKVGNFCSYFSALPFSVFAFYCLFSWSIWRFCVLCVGLQLFRLYIKLTHRVGCSPLARVAICSNCLHQFASNLWISF